MIQQFFDQFNRRLHLRERDTYTHTHTHTHINGGLDGEGSHWVDVVIEDDDSHHYSETEELSLLTLEPSD